MSENTLVYGVLVDVLGTPRGENKYKQQYRFDCPTCVDLYDGKGKGNLEVNLHDGVFNCWTCGEIHGTHGGLKKLFSKFANKNQLNKLKHLGIDVENFETSQKVKNVIEGITLPESFIEFSESNPKSLEHKQAWSYLIKQRKLTEDIIKKYRIGYTTSGKYANRIILPSYDANGELNYWVGRTYINQKPKYLNPDSDKEQMIFNECCLDWDSTIYLVEGPFDHIVVHNSIPMLGKKISDMLMSSLYSKSTADIVILLDSDAWKDTKNLYSKLNVGKLFDRIKVIKIEDGDIAEIQEKYGRNGVIDIMRTSHTLKESIL